MCDGCLRGWWSVALLLVGVVAGFAGREAAAASTTHQSSLAYGYDGFTPLRASAGSSAPASSPGSTHDQPAGEWRASDQPTSLITSDRRVATNSAETELIDDLVTSCHSFDRRTEVLMADGTSKEIGDVKVGDRVRTTDPKTGKTVVRRRSRGRCHLQGSALVGRG